MINCSGATWSMDTVLLWWELLTEGSAKILDFSFKFGVLPSSSGYKGQLSQISLMVTVY